MSPLLWSGVSVALCTARSPIPLRTAIAGPGVAISGVSKLSQNSRGTSIVLIVRSDRG